VQMLSERSHRKTDLYYLAGKVYGEAKEQIDNFAGSVAFKASLHLLL